MEVKHTANNDLNKKNKALLKGERRPECLCDKRKGLRWAYIKHEWKEPFLQ